MSQSEKLFSILIVDDEPDLLEIMSMRLQMEGFQTFTAPSAPDALDVLKKNPEIDVMVSDIRMPGESGIDLLAKVRERDPRAPILFFLTGSLNLPLEEAFSLGAEGIFRKPVHFGHLVEAIRGALERAEQFANSRQHTRLEVDFEVHLKIGSLGGKSMRFRMSNLGRGGMFIKMDDGVLPEIGDQVKYIFSFDNNALPRIEGLGKVVWIRHEARDGHPRGVGVEFISHDKTMDQNLLTLLNSIVVKSYIPQD